MKTFQIAALTFKEAIHDKILYALLGFGIFIILCARFAGQITPGEQVRMTYDFGFAALGMLTEVIALYYGCFSLFKEIERRSLHTLLSKPVSRNQVILGKYFGICMVLGLIVLFCSLFLTFVLWANSEPNVPNPMLTWNLPKAIFLLYMELILLTAIAVFFSLITSSAILCLLLTGTIFFIGLYNDLLKNMINIFPKSPVVQFVHKLAFILPNFQYFDVSSQAASFNPVPNMFVWEATAYGTCYAIILMILSLLIFSRRSLP